MSAPTVELLGRQHRPLLAGFQSQRQDLVRYLQRYALRHLEKDLLARTYVAVDRSGGRERIAGYFSLTIASVERASVKHIAALDKLPRFPIPGVLLARLAVDARVQGQGLGRYLFEDALGRVLRLAADGPVTFRLFVTDAIDAEAATFYERRGMMRISVAFPARMVLDLRPLVSK